MGWRLLCGRGRARASDAEILGEMSRARSSPDRARSRPARRASRTSWSRTDPRAARDSSSRRSPRTMRSITSTPRTEPMRHGVHLPQDSIAQNSIAKRACCAMSTVSSNTTTPPWPISPSLRGEGFVVERRVEQRAREIGAERAADLHRAHRPAGRRAAADIVDQLAQRQAERRLEQAAILDIAGQLDRHGAARAADAEIAIGVGAVGQDHRHRGERDHVVDDGRLAEQALMRRQRRLGAHLRRACLRDCRAARFPRRRHRRRRRRGSRCRKRSGEPSMPAPR